MRWIAMNAFGIFLTLISIVAFFVGVVNIIRPIQSLGLSLRRDGLFIIAGSFVLMIIAALQVTPKEAQRNSQARSSVAAQKADRPVPAQTADQPVPAQKADQPVPAQTADRPVSQSEALQNMAIAD